MQKKNRRGFTLIELLAVIVILAIIALIAVPVIMNVITKARISAFEDSAYGIVKAGEMYYTNALLEAEGMTEDQEFTVVNGTFKNTKSTDTLEISGSLPSSGKLMVTKDGQVALVISNGEYCIQKATSESKVKAVKQANCTDYKKIANSVFTTTTDGKAIPACITDNTTCSAEDIKNGIKVGVKVNDSETKDFYVMSDNTSENEITLIMNKNLGDPVVWVSKDDYIKAGGTEDGWITMDGAGNYDKGPLTALNYLESQTSSWTNIPSSTYTFNEYDLTRTNARSRLITYTEATELGCDYGSSGSCPTWLYGNLSNEEAYWTNTDFSTYYNTVYILSNNGLGANFVSWEETGIRPVITISKTIL